MKPSPLGPLSRLVALSLLLALTFAPLGAATQAAALSTGPPQRAAIGSASASSLGPKAGSTGPLSNTV